MCNKRKRNKERKRERERKKEKTIFDKMDFIEASSQK